MTIQDEQLWLEERLRAMNPTINLNEGSPANVQVLQPFVRRFQPDPLETNIKSFIIGRLRQEYPNITAEEGDAFIDMVVKPLSILLEPFRREIRSVKRNQSIADPSTLNTDEADAILANTFFTRSAGGFSRGKVRIYFSNPVTQSLGSSNVAYTATGRRYIVSNAQSITSSAMLLNTEGSLYYWDVDYVAEATGKAYDIGPNQIIGVTGIAAATKVTNPYKFSGGITEETTTEIIARASESIGERSLNTVPGAVAKLFEEFGDLKILQIIGFNDEEMERDVITGGSLGDVFLFGADMLVADDGDGYGSYVDSAGATFTTSFGPVGTDISNYVLTLWENLSGTMTPVDYQLGLVEGTTQLSINASYTNEARIIAPITIGTYWTIRKREILLSDIPGGILFPDTNGNELSVEPDQVHVGGCSDYYVNGGTQTEKTMALDVLADKDPIVKGLFIQTYDGSTEASDRVDVTMTSDQYDEITAGVTVLRIIDSASGNNIGTYTIVKKISHSAGVAALAIDSDFIAPEESSVYGELVDDIDIELNSPYEIVVEGDDLRTYAGTSIVDTISATIFTDYGMSVGPTDNKLIIESGNDAGTYEINTVAAASLTIVGTLADTTGPLPYKIIREMSSSALELPLRRVTKIEILDANSEPSGDIIPYRHPIDVQSRRFQNPGRGAKAGTDVAITEGTTLTVPSSLRQDTLGALDELGSPHATLNWYSLGVRAGDLVNINTGDNTGYYTVSIAGGSPEAAASSVLDRELRLTEDLRWADASMEYAVGPPSYGSFRVYFLDPCSADVDQDTIIAVPFGGTTRRFRPDPDVSHQYLPTDTTVPTLSMATTGQNVTAYKPDGSSTIRAWTQDINIGDLAEITYAPIIGVLDLTTPVGVLNGKSILIDLGSGSERVTFSAPSTLTGAEIVSQINAQLSESVASLYSSGGAVYLMLRSDINITLKNNSAAPGAGDATALIFGTTRATFMPWLGGVFANQDTPSDSHVKGIWTITDVNPGSSTDGGIITLGVNLSGTTFVSGYVIPSDRGHYVRLSREGYQRISSVDMANNVDSLGLYYWDIECISEGHGDEWNIDPDIQGTITGYHSEGWEMSVEDSRLSYSMAESPWIHITPNILIAGADDPDNYTTLLEQNIQIEYEKEDIVEPIHSFIRSSSERTVNNNPLARGLTPTMVRTSISYSGGYTESEARTKIADLIESIMPNRQLEISDIVQILADSGANFVTLPITVVGISHQVDRTITVERSENYISNDRLSVLVPDDDGTTTEGNSYIILSRS